MEPTVVDHSSMWSLVSNASVVVQLVMLVLVAASVTSWVMIFQRSNLLRAGRRALESFEERFWSGIDLSKLYRQAGSNPDPDSGVEQIFRAGFKEFSRLRQQPGVDPEAVMEGVARAMRVAISREEEKLEQSLPFLATVGSVSPYIGLFGTVWGIMNSFRGLAQAQQATLATVAPGIAEALIEHRRGHHKDHQQHQHHVDVRHYVHFGLGPVFALWSSKHVETPFQATADMFREPACRLRYKRICTSLPRL